MERRRHDVVTDTRQRGLASLARSDAMAVKDVQRGNEVPVPPPVDRPLREHTVWSNGEADGYHTRPVVNPAVQDLSVVEQRIGQQVDQRLQQFTSTIQQSLTPLLQEVAISRAVSRPTMLAYPAEHDVMLQRSSTESTDPAAYAASQRVKSVVTKVDRGHSDRDTQYQDSRVRKSKCSDSSNDTSSSERSSRHSRIKGSRRETKSGKVKVSSSKRKSEKSTDDSDDSRSRERQKKERSREVRTKVKHRDSPYDHSSSSSRERKSSRDRQTKVKMKVERRSTASKRRDSSSDRSPESRSRSRERQRDERSRDLLVDVDA